MILPLMWLGLLSAPVDHVPVPGYVQEVLDRWGPAVDVEVVAKDCGYDNAWYHIGKNKITLCSDLFDRPDLTRYVLNHELGHAFMDQHNVPFIDYEVAADELAMLISTESELLAAAWWYMTGAQAAASQHASDLDRAAAIVCFMDGWYDETPVQRTCGVYARSVVGNWSRVISMVL